MVETEPHRSDKPASEMKSRWWLWVFLAILAVRAFSIVIMAFREPWRSSFDQWEAIFFATLLFLVVAFWGHLWLREGNAGVKSRLVFLSKESARFPLNRRQFRFALVFWIVVALALVAFFNFMETR